MASFPVGQCPLLSCTMNNSPSNASMSVTESLEISLTREKIAASFLSQKWDWSESHSSSWRKEFYAELLLQSRSSPPLTKAAATSYLASLSSLPTQGFFPRPDIAAQSLALSSRFLVVCPPLPPNERPSSMKCAPAECSVDARTHIPKGTFLGIHAGWIEIPGEAVQSTTYSVHIHHNRCSRVIRCWDTHVSSSVRANVFPLSHINEYIWISEGANNPNNTNSSVVGEISSRKKY
jgi:hypothetical protein